MRLILFTTIFGILFILSGAGLFLAQILQIMQNPYPWLIDITSVAILLVGTFLLIRAKLAHTEATVASQSQMDGTIATRGMSLIEKQQQMGQEWEDTSSHRDKLKMLKMAGAAEDSSLS